MRQILIEKYIEPSEIKINCNYTYKSWFDKYDDLHSFMGQPAKIGYNSNGQIKHQEWYKKGVRHRDGDLPAYLGYCNEKISCKIWYKKGFWHRDGDLPAKIEYNSNKQIIAQYWYKKGQLHRDGILPAEIWYANGKQTYNIYYKNGINYVPKQQNFLKAIYKKLFSIIS